MTTNTYDALQAELTTLALDGRVSGEDLTKAIDEHIKARIMQAFGLREAARSAREFDAYAGVELRWNEADES